MHPSFGKIILALTLVLGSAGAAHSSAYSAAQGPGVERASDEAAIRAAMNTQVTAWNKGDISAFMATYEDSPETTTVGTATVNKGFAKISEHYKKAYATREQMGTLTFTDLDVRLLPGSSGAIDYAVATGKFHLDRRAKGEATKDDGIFSLVWHKSGGEWKILLDHTS